MNAELLLLASIDAVLLDLCGLPPDQYELYAPQVSKIKMELGNLSAKGYAVDTGTLQDNAEHDTYAPVMKLLNVLNIRIQSINSREA